MALDLGTTNFPDPNTNDNNGQLLRDIANALTIKDLFEISLETFYGSKFQGANIDLLEVESALSARVKQLEAKAFEEITAATTFQELNSIGHRLPLERYLYKKSGFEEIFEGIFNYFLEKYQDIYLKAFKGSIFFFYQIEFEDLRSGFSIDLFEKGYFNRELANSIYDFLCIELLVDFFDRKDLQSDLTSVCFKNIETTNQHILPGNQINFAELIMNMVIIMAQYRFDEAIDADLIYRISIGILNLIITDEELHKEFSDFILKLRDKKLREDALKQQFIDFKKRIKNYPIKVLQKFSKDLRELNIKGFNEEDKKVFDYEIKQVIKKELKNRTQPEA